MQQDHNHHQSQGDPSSQPSRPSYDFLRGGSLGSSDDDRASFTTAHTGGARGLSPVSLSPNLYASSASGLTSSCSSDASSTLLTPPHTPDESGRKPWKAPSSLDPSLNMLLARRSSSSYNIRSKRKQKRHRKHHCRAHRAARARKQSDAKRRPSYGWLPVQKVSIDASNMVTVADGERLSIQSNRMPDNTVLEATAADLRSAPAEPVLSRNWTSVGISDEPTLSDRSISNISHRYRSRTNSSDRVLDFVCSRLSARKVSVAQLETPASITLRRASSSKMSGAERKLSALTNLTSEAITPLNLDAFEDHDHDHEVNSNCPLSAYLITNKDIEQIAAVIHKAFSSVRLSSDEELILSKPSEPTSVHGYKYARPCVLDKGILPQTDGLAKSATTITARINEPEVTRNASYTRRQSSIVQRVYTTNGVNEVIWEESSSSSSSSCSLSPVEDFSKDTRAVSDTSGLAHSHRKTLTEIVGCESGSDDARALKDTRTISQIFGLAHSHRKTSTEIGGCEPSSDDLYAGYHPSLEAQYINDTPKVHFADTFGRKATGAMKPIRSRTNSQTKMLQTASWTTPLPIFEPHIMASNRASSFVFSLGADTPIAPSSRQISRVNSVVHTPKIAYDSFRASHDASCSKLSVRSERSTSDPQSVDEGLVLEVAHKESNLLKVTNPDVEPEGLSDIAETPEQEEASLKLSKRSSQISSTINSSDTSNRVSISSSEKSPGNSRRTSYIIREVSYVPQRKPSDIPRMGSGIGVNCRARRKSSIPIPSWTKGYSTDKSTRFDERNLKGHIKRKTWKKPRKDSGWPGMTADDFDNEDVSRHQSMSGFDEYEFEIAGPSSVIESA